MLRNIKRFAITVFWFIKIEFLCTAHCSFACFCLKTQTVATKNLPLHSGRKQAFYWSSQCMYTNLYVTVLTGPTESAVLYNKTNCTKFEESYVINYWLSMRWHEYVTIGKRALEWFVTMVRLTPSKLPLNCVRNHRFRNNCDEWMNETCIRSGSVLHSNHTYLWCSAHGYWMIWTWTQGIGMYERLRLEVQ